MTVCYLPKPSSPPANNIALPTSTTPPTPLPTFPSTDHFSFYLLTYVLSPLPPPVHPGAARSPTHHQRYRTTTHTSKAAHLPFLSTDYAAGVLSFFPSTDLPASPGRGEEIGRLIY